MNLEKLKPWNWFKHEEQTTSQIPVAKTDVQRARAEQAEQAWATRPATSSLLQLHQNMDRLFDEVWRSFGINSPAQWTGSPSLFNSASVLGDYRAQLDISGNDREYEISVDLPGMSQQDIQLELNDNVLCIRGKKSDVTETKDKQFYRVERSYGEFQRTLALPEDANRDDIHAQMKDGVLTIRIPRQPVATPEARKIPIQP